MTGSFLFLLALLPSVSGTLIERLPGASTLSTRQYHGYLNITRNNQMHYWFVESQDKPKSDPLILWLTGGPRCSGLFALFTEIGPYFVTSDGQELYENQYSWNRIANLLIFESPAGVGFSTGRALHTDDDTTMEHNFAALMQFFDLFPQYKSNDFYIAGESYAAVYIPMLARKILGSRNLHTQAIKLKGIAIGNGYLDPKMVYNSFIQYSYYHGFIGHREWERVKEVCCSWNMDDCDFQHHRSKFCRDFGYMAQMSQRTHLALNYYNLHAECRVERLSRLKRFAQSASLTCKGTSAIAKYLNRDDVREALSISPEIRVWKVCDEKLYSQSSQSMDFHVQTLLHGGLKVLLYYGDLDAQCNLASGEKFASKLGFKLTEPKYAFTVDDVHAGFLTRYGNLEVVVIQGAGHMVPTDKPKVALYMMENFIHRVNFKTSKDVDARSGQRLINRPMYLLLPLPSLVKSTSNQTSSLSPASSTDETLTSVPLKDESSEADTSEDSAVSADSDSGSASVKPNGASSLIELSYGAYVFRILSSWFLYFVVALRL